MSEYYNVVPWYDSKEWLDVNESIYTSSNKHKALQILLIWKARCPSLPSGIESTLTLLEVLIQDENAIDSAVNDQLLRLAYSSAIMRFVNHMLDTQTAKGSSLYQAARNMGVPDWIIDLRHDTAHSNNLPSIELLREAAQIGLEWLEKNYWLKYKQIIKDYKSGQINLDPAENNKIFALINFCTSLSFCASSKFKKRNLSEIPNASMRESIVNDARDLFGDQIDMSNLKTVSITALINNLKLHSKKLLGGKDDSIYVNKVLLGEDSLILSIDLLKLLGSNDFYHKNKLNQAYVQSFELLLTFLHTKDLLLNFLLELIQITCKTENDDSKSRLAALWVQQILTALGKLKQFLDKMWRTGASRSSMNKKELKSLYHQWFPSENINCLFLDMSKPVPAQLTDISFLQPIISTYNPYLKYFIRSLLNLVEPNLPKDVKDSICTLAEVISSPQKFPAVSTKIYTVNDLESKTLENVHNLVSKSPEHEEVKQNSDSPMEIEMNSVVAEQSKCKIGVWKICSNNHNWSACPIGSVPWYK